MSKREHQYIAMTEKKPNIGDYLRAGSCTGEPQINALNCLKNKDLTVFTDIINETDPEAKDEFPLAHDHWINQTLVEEDDKTLLFVAIQNQLYDFIDVLLQAGASASLFNPELGKAPIHVAAATGDARIFRLLFRDDRNRADPNATIKSSGRTALHICAEKRYEDCIDVLLQQRGVDPDVKDKKGAQTPLYLAAKARSDRIAAKLIEAGADVDHVCFGKTIVEHLKDKCPGFDPSRIQRSSAPIVKQISNATMSRVVEILEQASLFGKYQPEDLQEFQSLLLQLDTIGINTSVSGYTLLQKAVDAELIEFVEVLIREACADPNVTTSSARIPPVLMAGYRGNPQVLQILIKAKADLSVVAEESQETILHAILKNGGKDVKGGYKQCLELLLESSEIQGVIWKIINKRDILENTPLHYATQMWSQETVRKLLEVGANIGMKNHWDDIPITKIQPETMEQFLDEFCLEATGDVNHENFEITFNYSFLAPPKEDLPFENREGITTKVGDDPEMQKLSASQSHSEEQNAKIALPETQALWYMGQSKEHRHLLKHPVVTSFLYLKWGRIRREFNRNLRFYLLFVFVLTWFIFEKFGGLKDPSSDQKSIPFFHGAFIVFGIIMLLFVIRDWIMDIKELMKSAKIKENQDNGEEDSSWSCGMIFGLIRSNWMEVAFLVFLGFIAFGANTPGILWTSLLILTFLLVIREFFQVTVSLKRYLLSPENWLEVTVIILILFLLFHDETATDLKRHFSAVAIVLSWAELITLVGKHPKLTRYNVYVMMFYKVMGTFFFFLCWYAFFIVAFGLGFYIMLYKESPGDDDYAFFNSPWLALVKTSTMFVGELEFSDIPIDLDSPLCPLAYLFFLSFVFLIVVVLMNLLNGLAVSDTGLIQEKAEIVSYISRVETISYTESVLLGDPFNFLSNWPALKWLSNIPSCSFCKQIYRHRGIQRLFHKITGATGILLFYNFLPNKKLTLRPNSNRRECDFLSVELMDNDIIASAKNIVLKVRKEAETSAIEDRILAMERKLDLLLDKLSNNN